MASFLEDITRTDKKLQDMTKDASDTDIFDGKSNKENKNQINVTS